MSKDVKEIKGKNTDYYEKILFKKLYKWWLKLSEGRFIVIYNDDRYKIISSKMKTTKAFTKDIIYKWNMLNDNENIKAIIWSSQSIDVIQQFINYIVKKTSKKKLDEIIELKNIPKYLIDNYKKYFVKNKFIGNKDYTFKY